MDRKSAEERVVSSLLAVHRKSALNDNIALPMTRLDIADYLGLTIETITRMIFSLSRRGLIRTLGRHGVALQKLAALRGNCRRPGRRCGVARRRPATSGLAELN